MDIRRPLLAGLLAVAVAACGDAAASPREDVAAAPPPPPASAASVQLVERLTAAESSVLPPVTGMTVREARAALHGLDLSVVSFGRGRVSAQWPPAGDARPADRAVVVWVGAPPQPPPPALPQPQPQAHDTAVQAVPAAPAPPTAQPGGVTPGLEGFVPPPHPPRSNIRELTPAPTGQVLAGRASWYGPGFAGHTTACGGVFDPSAYTLASRELRCGTAVTVAGPGGRTVQATVTDWGPAEWTNRRFDLSQATFRAVAGLGAGVVDVTVTVR